jgi:maltooligosyltrehalose trehalohydrolase
LTRERDGYYADFGSMKDMAKALEVGFVYDGSHSEYRGRTHGKPLDRGLQRKLVAFLQNHDQIGNRARGERIAALAGMDRAKIGAAVALLSPYIPLLFQGEEWAASTPFQYFTSHEDLSLGAAISEGRRREFIKFGWNPESVPDPQDPETFRRSKLNWDELAQPEHADVLSWYRSLIAFRKAVAHELRGAAARARYDEAEGWFAVECGPVTVAFNLSASARRIPIAKGSELLKSSGAAKDDSDERIMLSPDGVAVLGAAANEAVADFLKKSRAEAARTSAAP